MNDPWQQKLRELPVEEIPECLLCGARGKVDRQWGGYLDLEPPFGVLRCAACRLRWLSPRPDAEGYKRLYSDALYFGGKGAAPEDYAELAKGRIGYFRTRIGAITKIAAVDAPLTILDYGAATGEFVRAARDEGHECTGIELSADARATAKAVNNVSLLPANGAEQISEMQFDVVHMNHVLEHMPDPLSHLRWCRRILRPRGLLVVEVPQQFDNDLDRLRRWLHVGGRQMRFDAYSLHHTYFFTPYAMNSLLQRSGFETFKSTTFDPNSAPLRPFSMKSVILRTLLGLADRLHAGGNVIEVFSQRS
jgi:SAM-dependent methyltransferase